MSIKDVIKTSVIEKLGAGEVLSAKGICFILFVSVLIGIYIFGVYKFSSKSAFYSKDLNITLAGMPIIVAAIMIAMRSSLIVSLGMVGALSIVRFRNAVKNPLDLLYLFWSISVGIISGVGLSILAVILCLMMTFLILLLQLVPNMKTTSVLVLRSRAKDVDWIAVKGVICQYAKNVRQKSRSYQAGETEIIYELVSRQEEELMRELEKNPKIDTIGFLSHDGEYRI